MGLARSCVKTFHDIERLLIVNMMVADDLAPNRRQAISSHHADCFDKNVVDEPYHVTDVNFRAIKQTMFERDREVGNPSVSL